MRSWWFALVGALLVTLGVAGWILADASPTGSRKTGAFVAMRGDPTPEPSASHVIYLNREGARLRPGRDDATHNRSSLVKHSRLPYLDVPAFAGRPNAWDTFVECVRSKFEPFDVEVVDQRPVDGSYVMAVVGGTADILGKSDVGHRHRHSTGLAPYNGVPIRNAVVLVFSRALHENVRDTCYTAAMEIAHAYGLDHAHHCKDLMTYLPGCAPKQFLDREVRCGEHEPRDCMNGRPTQSSFAHLREVLGLRAPASD